MTNSILLQNLVTFLTKNRNRKITNIIFSQISDTRHYWHIGFHPLSIEDLLIHYKAQYECWERYTDKNNEAQYDVLHFKLPEEHFLLIVMEPQTHQGLIEFYQELSTVREFMHFQSSHFKDQIRDDILGTLKRILRNFVFDTYLLKLFLREHFILFDSGENFYLNTPAKIGNNINAKRIRNYFNIPSAHADNFSKSVVTPHEEKFKLEYFKLMEVVDPTESYSVIGYKTIPLVFEADSVFENYRFLNQTSVPIAIFDYHTRIQFKNTAWINFFDSYDPSSFIKELNQQSFSQNTNVYDESMTQGRFIKWYFDPIIVAKTQYTLVTAIDSTHGKKEEIDTLKTLERLKQSNEDLQRFAHICSHDLKEPLRTISSFSQMLKIQLKEQENESINQYLDIIVKNTLYMKNLIEDLLRYSEFEFQAQSVFEVSVSEILHDVLNLLSSKIKDRRALIRMQDYFPETILCNRTQIMQIFQNLIDNGIKFNNKKVPIIDIGYSEEENVDRFFVKDNGLGVNAEYLGGLFTMFKRLHGKTEFPGSGIGLAMCKKIIENHNGRIWMESDSQQGSVVYFELPKSMTRRFKCAV